MSHGHSLSQHHKNVMKFSRTVSELCEQTDKQADRRTDRHTRRNTDHPLRGRSSYIMLPEFFFPPTEGGVIELCGGGADEMRSRKNIYDLLLSVLS